MTDSNIADELKRLSRRIDEQRKNLDLLMADRNILEDILTRMTAVENAMHLQRSTATENAKDIKADIVEVRDAVEAKVGEVSESMDDKTVILKSSNQNVIQKIFDKVSGK
jgi:hypothetical protein